MKSQKLPLLVLVLFPAAVPAFAELTLPPSGDNQRATVTQQIGPVVVSVEYSSPRVTLKGDNRRGKIWGQLVPYGLTKLAPDCPQCPWRAGANENTIFTASRDVKVQGQTLPAGKYGLHMMPGKEQFTVIFSKNSTAWGSYSYDAKEDALRVTTSRSRPTTMSGLLTNSSSASRPKRPSRWCGRICRFPLLSPSTTHRRSTARPCTTTCVEAPDSIGTMCSGPPITAYATKSIFRKR